jgi:hypothetical protein
MARRLRIPVASHERTENGFLDAGGLHGTLRASKPKFLGRYLPVRWPAHRCLALKSKMKTLIRILLSSSIQRLPNAEETRIGTQIKLRPIGARVPTMLFPMSLTLEGYHVCGGPVFE